MGSLGISYVLKDEVVRLESVYSMDTDFRFRASPFLVKESLLFAKFGEWLARKASDVDMYFALGVDVWVMPGVRTNFQRGEIFPDEGSGYRSGFRGADQDVWDV